jgi:hypothetical protein
MDYDSEVGNAGFVLSSSQTIRLLMPKNVPVKVLRGGSKLLNFRDILTPSDAVTENPRKYLYDNITNPTVRDGVKMS